MRTEKWDMYIECLQGHSSVCKGNHTLTSMYFITQFIPPKQYPKMLNIGAGEGLESYILSKLGYDVTGIINGKVNSDFASKNYPHINFIDTDFHDLPFKSESFDCVYMNQTFEHSYAPFIFLIELYCILKDRGLIWIAVPHFKEIDDPTIGEPNKLNHHHPNILCNNLFKQMFHSTGFKIKYHLSIKENSYFDNPYLLEKQPLETSGIHSDVKTAIETRKAMFG